MNAKGQPPTDRDEDQEIEIDELGDSELRDLNFKINEDIAVCQAKLNLLLNTAVQYELDRVGGTDGIEVIASVASMPPSSVWKLLAGHYPPNPRTWVRIERILMLCHASRGVERVTAARMVYERLSELSAKRDQVSRRRMELNRLRRAKEVGLGAGNSARRHSSDVDAVTAPRPFVADHADKNNSATVRAAEVGNPAVSDDGTELDPPFTPPAIPDLRGHDHRPDPLRAKTEAEFVAAMRAYKAWAGNPSFREMERRCAKQMSYTTFRNMLKSSSLPPKLAQVETFVKVLGGTTEDLQRWATAWRQLTMNDFSAPGSGGAKQDIADKGSVRWFSSTPPSPGSAGTGLVPAWRREGVRLHGI